jgi:DNA polymerase III delta prime subunit
MTAKSSVNAQDALPRTALRALRQLLSTWFNLDGLRTLCFELDVEYEDLPAETRSGKARELIIYLDRRGRISDLVTIGAQLRPDIPWQEAVELGQAPAAPTFLQRVGRTLAEGPEAERARHAFRARHIMLERVRDFWISGVLEQSLHGVARIEPGLVEQPDAVERPWEPIVRQHGRGPQPLAANARIGEIFDELGEALLILGGPGSGKTTLLLELANELLDRATRDATHPIPAVFNLSSWAAQRKPLAEWLVDELNLRYDVPRKVGRAWVEGEQLLPLLDGLDEVDPAQRQACVATINTFRQAHGFVPLAVCSREVEYGSLATKLRLAGAVVVQPLAREQVAEYVAQAGTSLAGVCAALAMDESLWELLDTPLMLSVATMAYREQPAEVTRPSGSPEERRTALFAAYVDAVFQRRSPSAYTRRQTVRWLGWLARAMSRHAQSEFYAEGLDPTWLPARAQRVWFHLGIRLLAGWISVLVPVLAAALVIGLCRLVSLSDGSLRVLLKDVACSGLPTGLATGTALLIASLLSLRLRALYAVPLTIAAMMVLVSVCREWQGGLLAGGIYGLIGGWAGTRLTGQGEMRLAEALAWDRRKAIWGAIIGFVPGLAIQLLVGQVGRGLPEMLLVALPFVLLFAVLLGLVPGPLQERRVTPNQGIRNSLGNAFRVGLGVGGVILILAALACIGTDEAEFFLLWAAIIGAPVGLASGLGAGGSVCIQHLVLRILLWRADLAPLDYVRFLDDAVERILLRRVGGGYLFRHGLLLEYFASPVGPRDKRGGPA